MAQKYRKNQFKPIEMSQNFIKYSKLELIELLRVQPGLTFRNLQKIFNLGRDVMRSLLYHSEDIITENSGRYYVRCGGN